jgi:hypothetical protein
MPAPQISTVCSLITCSDHRRCPPPSGRSPGSKAHSPQVCNTASLQSCKNHVCWAL